MKNRMSMLLALSLTSATLLFAQGNGETLETYTNVSTPKTAKNIILLIGDGMSTAQITTADAYLGSLHGEMMDHLSFESFKNQGLTTTYSYDKLITDSAAAGTALATGHKTYSGGISVDPVSLLPYQSILKYAEDEGKSTGIVTTTRVTHATPAVFISHNTDRNAEDEIALEESTSGVDYLVGGGYRYFLPQNNTKGLASKRNDTIDIVQNMQRAGYTTFISENDTEKFNAYTPQAGDKVLGLFASSHLDYAIDKANQPTLAQLTKKGIDLLSQDKDGFFMMVEGGRIDHACHANDAVTAIEDTLAFDNAVKEAIAFYQANKEDTLLIITGDHETGGLTLGFAGTHYESAFHTLSGQKISYEKYGENKFANYKKSHTVATCRLSDFTEDLSELFGLDHLTAQETAQLTTALQRSCAGEVIKGNSDTDYLLYGGYEPFIMEITHILNNRAGVAWTSYSHTAVPVATFAIGPTSEQINGMFDNTQIFTFMANAMGLDIVQ